MAGVEGDDAGAVLDHIVTQFNTYEEYLDSQITTQDLFYLENEEMARQLVELGFRGSGEVLKREDFIARKLAAEASRISERQQQKILSSAGKELKDNFLKALAEREEANRNGKVSSIIFIRDRNARGQEVSAYIDYAHRLKVDEFDVYFSGKKKLFPRRSDLSLSKQACPCFIFPANWSDQLPLPDLTTSCTSEKFPKIKHNRLVQDQ
ncbi:cilia- and flagella-associated protein 299 isoform X2 [Pantherophis guttatus]|uniref:Cilia- and flagella-associated protein 299 n=1 Tax=Pantherophis guttatus TaxID=94885 RepID=A0A6P9CRF3_PANGU|nr:cilia- and flagella-associated protein 299 isoform X2 [Pantherophis guttatus]